MKMTDTIIPQDLSDHDNLIFSYGKRKLVIKDLPTRADCTDMELVLDRTEKKENIVKGICVSLMVLAVCMAAFAMMACTKAFEGNERESFMRIVNICILLLLFCGTIWVAGRFQYGKVLRDVLNQNDPTGSLRIKYLGGFDLTSENGIAGAERHMHDLYKAVTQIHKMLELEKKGLLKRIKMETSCSASGNVTIKYSYADEKGDLSKEVIGLTFEMTENVIMEPDTAVMDFRDMTFRYSYDNTDKEEKE